MIVKKHSLKILTATIASILPMVAHSSSFQILEQSPAHLGNAFAGTASDISDASSVFFNPAAIGRLNGTALSIGANAIFTKAEFSNENSNTNGIESKTDEIGYVPNIYWATPLSERLTLGLGLNAPYGLASEYDKAWMGRYLATHSELEVANLGAVLAYKINDIWSIGLGVDYQRAKVTLESQIDSTFGIKPDPATDSHAKIEGDDTDVNGNVSLYFAPGEQTSVGLVWRQGGEFDLEGDATFTLNAACSPGAGFPTGAPPKPTTGTLCAVGLNALKGNATASVHLPDTVTLSGTHQLNEHWWIHSDIAWTQWSNIQTINVVNSSNNLSINKLELNYKDSMRYAVGFTYKADSPWTWRFGVAFDEAPQTNPALVSPRIPDQDRIWFSGGFNYALSTSASIDVGYTYIDVKESKINNTDLQTGHHVEGHFDPSVNIVGVQLNWMY